MKIVSEGAEARIYGLRLLGRAFVMKSREAKRYRMRELDENLRRQRTRMEARIQSTLYGRGLNVPGVALVGRYFIVMEAIGGDTLNVRLGGGRTGIKAARILSIMEEAGRQLAEIHAIGVTHGDFTTANLMLDKAGKLWVIDFGLSAYTDSDEDRALDVLLMKRSVDKDLYTRFLKGYKTGYGKKAQAVLTRLAKIETRGRYQARTISTA